MRISLAATLLLALLLVLAPSGRSRAQDDKKTDDAKKEDKKQVVKQDDDNDPEPAETKYIRIDRKKFTKRDKLTANCPRDAGRGNAISHTFVILLDKGKSYQFDLRSTDFDAYLRVLDPNGTQIAFNDDFPGEGLNSRIILQVPTKGQYKVIASSLGGQQIGNYEFEAKVQ
jgi:hypothetical protein